MFQAYLFHLRATPSHAKRKGNGAGGKQASRPAGPGSALRPFCQPEFTMFYPSLGYTGHPVPVEGCERGQKEQVGINPIFNMSS